MILISFYIPFPVFIYIFAAILGGLTKQEELTPDFKGSMNVHRDILLLLVQCSFVLFFFYTVQQKIPYLEKSLVVLVTFVSNKESFILQHKHAKTQNIHIICTDISTDPTNSCRFNFMWFR